MTKITKEDWDIIHDREHKIRAIKTLRGLTGLDLRMAKNAVEGIFAGTVKLADICQKADPCPHCDGTGFTK